MYRLVPIENAKTGADAEAYVTLDTGRAVIPIEGQTEAVDGRLEGPMLQHRRSWGSPATRCPESSKAWRRS